MKTSLWIVVIVVVGFLGFLIGYSIPPFVNTGVVGGGGKKVETGTKIDKEMQDYYKNLLKDENK